MQILGWRPTNGEDIGARQDFEVDALEDAKKPQKREYLVKWKNKAFRHVCLFLFGAVCRKDALR